MAEAYRGDIDLMENLGLDWQKPFRREWTDLGTVKLYDDEPLPTIKVEVSALPAQFFRFTVTRKADTVEPAPNEVLVIRTGSGSLATYWPSVRHVAQNCFDVTTVGRYRAIRPSRAGGQPVTVYEETSGAEAMPREVANAMSLLLNAARIDPVLRDAAVKVERYIRDLADSEHTGAGE